MPANHGLHKLEFNNTVSTTLGFNKPWIEQPLDLTILRLNNPWIEQSSDSTNLRFNDPLIQQPSNSTTLGFNNPLIEQSLYVHCTLCMWFLLSSILPR